MLREASSQLRLRQTLRTVVMPVVLIFVLLFGNLAQAQDPIPPTAPSDGVAKLLLAPLNPEVPHNSAQWSVRTPGFGDVNADGRVDIVDVQLVASHWGMTPADPGWNVFMDINGNDVIDVGDITAIATVWNRDAPGGDVFINEVMFAPVAGDVEWVELKNDGPAAAWLLGHYLTDEDGNEYHLPAALPSVPPGAFVVVLFDGLGAAYNDYDFGDNVATLHTESGLVDVFEDDTDQVALYAANIVDFVAWGGEPGEDAANAAAAYIWFADWAVTLSRGLGVQNPTFEPGETIGLLPGASNSSPNDWEQFQANEATPGEENVVPVISWYTPEDGAIVAGATIAVAWSPVAGATGYRFQWDDSPDFTSPQVDAMVTEARYVFDGGLPDGVYYWRVQVHRTDGTSDWSSAASIQTVTLSQVQSSSSSDSSSGGPSASKELGIVWQLQHKDTRMLDLEKSPEYGEARWDGAHEDENGVPVIANRLDEMYCVRASTSMMASYYGGNLSQDRISYEFYKDGGPGPFTDLGHGKGPVEPEIEDWLDWALGDPNAVTYMSVKPTYSEIRQWIDEDRPIGSLIAGHMRVVTGYCDHCL